jgi:hypothetical protein
VVGSEIVQLHIADLGVTHRDWLRFALNGRERNKNSN